MRRTAEKRVCKVNALYMLGDKKLQQPMSTKGVKSNQGRNLLKLDAASSVKRENLVFDGG